jgi:hypothetical protein
MLSSNGITLGLLKQLLWKISDTFFNKRQFEESLSWTYIANHDLLNTSTSNDAKIQRQSQLNPNTRRIVRCLLELEKFGEARDVISQIKESPPHALTCVLQFQVAVRCGAEDLGMSSCRILMSNEIF